MLHDQNVGGYRYLHIGVQGDEGTGLWLMPATEADQALVGEQAGGHPLLVLYTADLAVVRDRLSTAGVEFWAERQDPDSASLHFRDLYGNVIIAAQLGSGNPGK